MVRLRLLDEVMPEIKKIDPETALTRNAVRQLGISGKIPVLYAGRRRLYNIDALIEFMGNQTAEQQDTSSRIHVVSEKIG